MPVPACTAELPEELTALIAQFGAAWAASGLRPAPPKPVLQHWRDLLADWIASPDLPLLVRKQDGNRGAELVHHTGRRLIPTDNSGAHWSFTLACEGQMPTLNQIREWFRRDEVPVVMIQRAIEKPKAKYHCSLARKFNVNEQGWKLAHIEPVGLKFRQSLVEAPIARLEDHFRLLMSPANMFVMPLAWAGLAEVKTVIQSVVAYHNDA